MNKPTKNKIIILLLILLLLASAGFYYWRYYKGQNANQQTTVDMSTPFPTENTDNNGNADTNFSSNASAGSQSSSGFEATLPILRQISNSPVAGGIAFKQGGATVIRYVDRGTGHIYETNDLSLENITVSNTTIPKVPESIWSQNGQTVIMRYLNENNSILGFSANIIAATTSQDISKNPKSIFLPSNMAQLSVNLSGDKVFYLINDIEGTIGSISNIDGSQKRWIFQSPIKEWLASWPESDTVTLATKPGSNAQGYLFFLNSKTGATSKIMSGVNGLTALINNTAKNILYSESVDGSFKLKYRNLTNNDDKELSFKTLPEKCAWSRTEDFIAYCAVPKTITRGDYPDFWYQGLISFTDNVWKVDTKTGSSELVFDIQKETGNAIDIMNPFLSEDDEYLFFTNKKDLTFWSLAVKKQVINKGSLENPNIF